MAELTGQTPLFGGSTGGLLSKAETEEKWAITWSSPEAQIFEMPTGGAATMHEGENLLYLSRKEQCLALGIRQLRAKKITDYKIYNIPAGGEATLVHPNDGNFPEKVTEGRQAVNTVNRSIGKNPDPSTYKFTDRNAYD